MTLMDIVKEYDEIVRKRKVDELIYYKTKMKGKEYYFLNDMRKKIDMCTEGRIPIKELSSIVEYTQIKIRFILTFFT